MARTSAAEWAVRVDRWQRSGLSARAFGEREGIAPAQLAWWKWRLGGKAAATAPALVAVRVVDRRGDDAPVDGGGAIIEVVLPSGARLRVARGADEPDQLVFALDDDADALAGVRLAGGGRVVSAAARITR